MPTPEDYAWAAGYFDGEGSSSNFRGPWNADDTARIYVRCSVGQKDRRTLDRFFSIVGVGQFVETTMNAQPFFTWRCQAIADVILVQNVLRFHLGVVKQQQLQRAIDNTTLVSGHYKRKLPVVPV